MRSEKEMFDLILGFAQDCENVRAVILNGSRTNEKAPVDQFQDYDIVYIVRNIEHFANSKNWINIFGQRTILQMPESMRDPIADGRLTYLMLFKDKNRIDLQLIPIEKWEIIIENSSLAVTLLDKDDILPNFKTVSDIDFIEKKPSEKDVFDTCNEFWWCLQNVAKGICRDELPYAKTSLDIHVRDQLHNMVSYYIGSIRDFSVSIGKFGKYFKKYLPDGLYIRYKKTYSDATYDNMWDSIFIMCELFTELSKYVCSILGYRYIDYSDVLDYLEWAKTDWKCKKDLQT